MSCLADEHECADECHEDADGEDPGAGAGLEAFESFVEGDAEGPCDDASEAGERDVDAHVLGDLVLWCEVEVPECPAEHAAAECDAFEDREDDHEPEELEACGDEQDAERDDEDPGVDRAELEDVGTTLRPHPQGNLEKTSIE